MAGQAFRYQHRVTYGDCTVGNHVYYGNYLRIFEAARGELFRAAGIPLLVLQNEDTIFPVIECQLRYRGAARYDDVLKMEIYLTDLGRVRMQFGYRVYGPNDALLVEASTTHACTSLSDEVKRIPENVQKALSPYLTKP